jgi:DNA-binding CsgD family transcriptional regulator
MGRLSRREAAVLYLWVTGYSQAEVAEIMGVNQSTISRILANMHKKS